MYIKKDETFLVLEVNGERQEIKAPYTGYFVSAKEAGFVGCLALFYKNEFEAKYRFYIEYDKEKAHNVIRWYDGANAFYCGENWHSIEMSISFNIHDNKPYLKVSYDKFKLNKKDEIIFIGTNDELIIKFILKDSGYKSFTDKKEHIEIGLTYDDINILKKKQLKKIKINSGKGGDIYEIWNKFQGISGGKNFILFVKSFEKALEKAGLYLEKKSKRHVDSDILNKDDFCYVYLMLDNNTNFYKIGISKDPQYREKTLQSEKPVINLLASKSFPSRQIASAIESSLHKVYFDKHVRGEWFCLSKKDVLEILETLK
jgi:hypothetical protein